jgi:hypothetical protein
MRTRQLSIRLAALLAILAAVLFAWDAAATAVETGGPFDKLAGRWTGEGRLGIRGDKTEVVKCRVTYFVSGQGSGLRQTIRCASAGGSIEVQTQVVHADGRLTGSWKELVRDMQGELKGTVTEKGFKVTATGGDLTANMVIILRESKQIIEIQFIGTPLIGLTLSLTKDSS